MTSETEPASEEFLANSRAGAGFEAVLANAAFGGFGGLLPSAELGRLAKAMVRSPKPVARRVVDLAARAPTRLGNDACPPLGDAPGEYVKRLVT